MRRRSLHRLSPRLLLAAAALSAALAHCSDVPFTPAVNPPFWSSADRPIETFVRPLPPPSFHGTGDDQTFALFRTDAAAERALDCATRHPLQTEVSADLLEAVFRTRGFDTRPAAAESASEVGDAFRPLLGSGRFSTNPTAQPSAHTYYFTTSITSWGFSRDYVLVWAAGALKAQVCVQGELYDPRVASLLWSVESCAGARVGEANGNECEPYLRSLSQAQVSASERASTYLARWKGLHHVGFTVQH